jgi:hypothetical protein
MYCIVLYRNAFHCCTVLSCPVLSCLFSADSQFGLELQVVDKRGRAPAPQAPSMFAPAMGPGQQQQQAGFPPPSSSLSLPLPPQQGAGVLGDSAHTMEFLLPKEQAGAVIGKGGQGLRDIRQETVSSVQFVTDWLTLSDSLTHSLTN